MSKSMAYGASREKEIRELVERENKAADALAARRQDIITSELNEAQLMLQPQESSEEQEETPAVVSEHSDTDELNENCMVSIEPPEPIEVRDIHKTISLLRSILPEKDSDFDSEEEYSENQDLMFDLLKFGINLIGLDGPISLNVSDMRDNPENKKSDNPENIIIGTEGSHISVEDVVKCLKELAVLMPKRARWHFAGIHETSTHIARQFYGAPKPTSYRISFD